MYQLCLLEPALFRFLHDAPRSELLIDLPGRFFRLFEDTCRRGAELHPRNRRESRRGSPKASSVFGDVSGGNRAAVRSLGGSINVGFRRSDFHGCNGVCFLFKCACCGQSTQWRGDPQEPLIWHFRSFYTFTLLCPGTFMHRFIQSNLYLLTDNQTDVNKAFCIILSLSIHQ